MRKFWLGQYGPLREAAGEGDGGGGGPAFDPAAFKTELLGDVGREIAKALKNFKPPEPPPKEPPVDPPADPPSGGKVSPEVARLLKQVETLTKTVETERGERTKTEAAAKEKERLSLIRTELAKHGLAEHSVDDAFRFFRDEVKVNEAGDLVGGDDVPLADFVKATVEKRAHWLPPKPAGGAGAKPGSGGKPSGVTLDDIQPGMKPETRQAAVDAIKRVLTGN